MTIEGVSMCLTSGYLKSLLRYNKNFYIGSYNLELKASEIYFSMERLMNEVDLL